MIVLDANVLIGFLDANDAHHAAALDLLERHFVDGFAASVLTVAEVMVHPARAHREDAALAALETIGVRTIPFDANGALELARIRSEHRLRMPDAVVLLTAMSTHSRLATFDDGLLAVAERAGIMIAN